VAPGDHEPLSFSDESCDWQSGVLVADVAQVWPDPLGVSVVARDGEPTIVAVAGLPGGLSAAEAVSGAHAMLVAAHAAMRLDADVDA
jgi:hypothetical protein